MALLTHLATGRTVALVGHAVIGRSPACHVHIRSPVASADHASLRWRAGEWWLKDLASRNGTWIDGQPLSGGDEARVVKGARMSFGDLGDAWILEDAGPPGAVATCLDTGGVVASDGGVLMLPDDSDPDVALLQQPAGSWILDDAEASPVRDRQILDVTGQRWRVHLPSSLDSTAEARPRDVSLRFRVSLDEEYVEIDVVDGAQSTRLRPRSFNYTLLVLARHRLADAELPETSRGWLDQEELARMLAVEYRTVNVHLFRARQALGKVRDDLATRLIERRVRASQVRFGLDDVEVEQI